MSDIQRLPLKSVEISTGEGLAGQISFLPPRPPALRPEKREKKTMKKYIAFDLMLKEGNKKENAQKFYMYFKFRSYLTNVSNT